MTRTWGAIGAVIVGILGLLLFQRCRDSRDDETIGKLKERNERLARDSAAAQKEVRRTDTLFFRDTVTFTKAVTRYKAIHDSVLVRLTDTLTVERFVTVADSTIRACRDVVASCEARVAARDTMIRIISDQRSTDRSLFRAELKRANPRVIPYVEALVDPFAATNIYARAGVEWRVLGRIRLVGALQWENIPQHTLNPLAGVRVTF